MGAAILSFKGVGAHISGIHNGMHVPARKKTLKRKFAQLPGLAQGLLTLDDAALVQVATSA